MPNESSKANKPRYSAIVAFIVILATIGFSYYESSTIPRIQEQQLVNLLKKGKIKSLVLKRTQGQVHIFLTHPPQRYLSFLGLRSKPDYTLIIPNSLIFDNHYQAIKNQLPKAQQIEYTVEEGNSPLAQVLYTFIYYILLLLFMMLFVNYLASSFSNMSGGGGVFGLGKSKAKFWNKEKDTGISFDDVIGMVEAKEEVKEIIDFFKKSDQFNQMGAKLPKGILLVGPPGTGKTLLARAVAGETKVNFIYTSGPDFMDIFMGVAAMRVQDLFQEARKNSPCIVFIDEIDAIGRARSRSVRVSNQDGDNTLNQFLTEMDGFTKNEKMIVIGATNRLSVMDKALLRPGRFDRKIAIGLPRLEDRKKTFDHYISKLPKVAKNINTKRLAEQTCGLSPAAIANICNEATIRAVRQGKEQVDMSGLEASIDREIGGIEKKKSMIISKEEKKIVAYHEAGHALVSYLLPHAPPLVKVSTIPRGEAALGFTQYQPEENIIRQEKQFLAQLAVLLAGRAAERIVFGELSTGASDDLKRATQMSTNKVAVYGMSKKVGHISYPDLDDPYRMGKPFSEETASLIDQEIKRLLDEAYQSAFDILSQHKNLLEKTAKVLLKKEIILKTDLAKILGPRPSEKKETKEREKAPKAGGASHK